MARSTPSGWHTTTLAALLLHGGVAACKPKTGTEAAREYLAGLGKRYTPKELSETTALVLEDVPVTDEGLARLAEFPRLEILDLARDAITDAGLEHLGKLARLRALGLAGTRITDAGLAGLAGLSSLTALHLAHTGISDAGLTHLHALKQLRKVNLSDTQVTDQGIAALRAALPGIEVVRQPEPAAAPR